MFAPAATVMSVFSGAHRGQRLAILIYHRILPLRDPLREGEPTVAEFDIQMRLLRAHFKPLALLDAVDRLHAGDLPARAVCVTFDDGYADNEQHAMPVLRRYQIPATVFVSTGFLNGGRMWNDTIIETVRHCASTQLDLRDHGLGCYPLEGVSQRLRAIAGIIRDIKHLDPARRGELVGAIKKHSSESLPRDLMLTDSQVRSLARNGISVGAHTVSHPILGSIPEDVARREIGQSKATLEQLLQHEVDTFAYPNGKPSIDYRPEHRDMVAALGFRAAVPTHWGVGTCDSDRYQLPRFTPWDRSEMRFGLRLLASYRRIDPLAA